MIFFHVIHHIAPGSRLYVETTISGFCLFTKFESRAKLFTLEEADELVRHLQYRKPKNHYAKTQAYTKIDPAICFTPPGNKISDHGIDPESEEKKTDQQNRRD